VNKEEWYGTHELHRAKDQLDNCTAPGITELSASKLAWHRKPESL